MSEKDKEKNNEDYSILLHKKLWDKRTLIILKIQEEFMTRCQILQGARVPERSSRLK